MNILKVTPEQQDIAVWIMMLVFLIIVTYIGGKVQNKKK